MKDYPFDAFIRSAYTSYLQYVKKHPYDIRRFSEQRRLDCPLFSADFFFSQDEDIACIFHQNHPYALMPHQHDFFELIYAYRGGLTHTIRDKKYLLAQGDICLLNPHAPHFLEAANEDTIVINVLIRPRFLDRAFHELTLHDNVVLGFFSDCFYHSAKHYEILFPHAELQESNVYAYLHPVIREYLEKKEEYRVATGYALMLFCLELTRTWRNRSRNLDHRAKTAVDNIIEYLYENIQTATLESTARQFHYHRTYLPQYLKRHTGRTFVEILQGIRLNIAKQKLATSSMTTEEIASCIGYSNTASFYRMFKQETGLSPSQYRKKYTGR